MKNKLYFMLYPSVITHPFPVEKCDETLTLVFDKSIPSNNVTCTWNFLMVIGLHEVECTNF